MKETLRNTIARVFVFLRIYPHVKHSPSIPAEIVGYGLDNGWVGLSHSEWHKLARALVKAGCNTTGVELLSWGTGTADLNADRYLKLFADFLTVMRIYSVTTDLNIGNDNMGHGKYGDTRKRMEEYGRPASEAIGNKIKSLGKDLLIVQAVSEWEGTFASWYCSFILNLLPGWRHSWNRGSRPGSMPAGYWCHDWHPSGTSDFGRGDNCLLKTDHGNIIREFWGGDMVGDVNEDKITAYVREGRTRKRGVRIYDFKNVKVGYKCIEAIGRALR